MTHQKRLTFRSTTRIARGAAILAAILVTAATLTGFTSTAAVASGFVLDLGKPVPGGAAAAIALNAAAASSGNTATAESSLPAAATYSVTTQTTPAKSPTTQSIAGSPTASTTREWSALGDTGIAIAPASAPATAGKSADTGARAADPLQSLSATILDPATVKTRGLSGLVLELKRTDSKTSSTPVAVRIPNALLDGLYGADYASRVRWVQVPGTTASTSAASAQPVSATQDTANKAVVLTPTVGSSAMMLAATATPTSSSGTGSFAATSLKPASTWDVSAQTGDFSWTYPMRTPPAAAGPSPSLALSYDSQSVDGETGSSNNQPSTVGDGWSLGGGGFIEQSYVPCALDNGASGPNTNSGDLCWKTDNATISLGGHSGQLVKDATTGTWKLQSDDGSRVEHLVGTAAGCAANGTYDTDCWRLTSRDGTQYYFGLNRLPGWSAGAASTQSVFTAPVYGNDPGEPCHAATFAASSCTQGWRWNLDYVVDTHHNAEALYYTPETNKYAQNGAGATSYTRGGQLDHIDYGLTSTTVYAANAANDKVVFSYDTYGRCNDTSHANCTAEPLGTGVTPAHPTAYPDVPFDQLCTATSCPTQLSPTFWTTAQLATITTEALKAGSYTNVDSWTFGHSFPDPGDLTNAALWLTQINHTGYAGGSSLTEPPTLFSGVPMQNRVNVINGLAPLDKWRISSLTTSTGAVISVNYSAQECTPAGAAAIEAAPESNHKRCFPQWWTPQITPPVAPTIDLFHKYVVTSVISNPETGGGNDQTQQTTYNYTGTPAWRYDNSPLTIDKQRTWSQYAGYDTVEIRVGGTPATAQTTDYTFYQGMDGDRATSTGGTKTVKVNGTTVADSLWFAGTVRETKVLNGVGGAAVTDTTTTPWASAVTANDNTRTARLAGVTEVVKTEPVSPGGNRTTDTTTAHENTYGLPVTVNTVTSDAGTTCTTYTYAAANTSAWLIGLPSETAKVGMDCGTVSSAVYPKDAISDSRMIYDAQAQGAAATIGNVTTTRVVDTYTGTTASTAHWIDASTISDDAFGRTTSTKDVLGRTTSTAYTPAATAPAGSGALTSTTSTNPLNWTTTTDVDPAWGAETKATDQNGNVTTATYDALGRRVGVWLPNWAQGDNPTQPSTGYTYTLSQTGPNAVSTNTLKGGQAVQSYVLFDGLGQQVQTQGPADSNGMTVTDTLYDSAGRNYMTNNKYWTTSAAPSASLFVPQSEQNIGSETLTNYDGAGRVLSAITNSYLVEQYRTTNTYPGADKTDTVPPAGGTPSSSYTNSLGQQTKLTQWLSATTTGTSQSTTYSYNPSGAMVNMTDPAGNQWTWGYDVLGHQTQAVDPDTGTTTSTYDTAGNIQSTTDARGTVVAYTYDTLNRKTGKYQNASGAAGSLLAKWDWDTATNGKGLLAKSSSYTGSVNGTPGIAYTDTITGYDGLNNPTSHTISIPATAPAFGGTTYTTGLHYYPDGAYYATEYPAVAGLAAENVFYSYNNAGHLIDVGITDTAYANVIYTSIGQVAQISHFGLDITENTAYGYNVANGETQNIRDMTTAGGVVTDQAYRQYSHDNAGNVTAVSTSGTAATDTQCYTYDKLRELTAAWTPTNNSCAAAPTASTIGGPAPFWKSYTFDTTTGNRTGATTNPITTAGPTTASVYTYPAAAAAHPHAVKTVATTTSGTTTTNTYGYDAAGNTTTRPGQTLTYDPNGKLATVKIGTNTQNNVYDASGNLLLQKDPTGGSTLHLGDTQLHQAAGSTATSVVRTYSMNGTPVAERDCAGGATTSVLYYLGTDIDGTADLEINATSGTVTHRYQDPYGNTRGTAATWSSPNGYLNAPKSTFSGLTNIGARPYDPVIGKFLTVDSVLAPYSPEQNNGYSYAANSPITMSDPTGNCATIDDYVCPGKAPSNSPYSPNPNNNHGGGDTPAAAGGSSGGGETKQVCVGTNLSSCNSGSGGKLGTATNSTTGGTNAANLQYQAWVAKTFSSAAEATSQIRVCTFNGVTP